MKRRAANKLIAIVFSLLYLIMIPRCINEASVEREVARQNPSYDLSSYQLYEEYKANEIAADQKYKGKILAVTGEIDSIGKDITDTIYITLKGDEYFGSVQCLFPKKSENKVAALSKGQYVTVRGKCLGKMMIVALSGCILYTSVGPL